MKVCDVVVIGGGPAGSTCAWHLRARGLEVVVVDRQAFPRDKVCAGWITPAVVDTLDLDLDDYANGRVLQPITGFRTGLMDGRTVETDYARVVSYGIRRCEFDHYLLERSGARVMRRAAVEEVRHDGQAWVVDGAVRAPVLVGAGGHFCPVARLLGARRRADPVVAAQEIEFHLGSRRCAVSPERPELYFSPDLKGYGWCFRKGDYLNIGLGRLDRQGLSAHAVAFRRFLEREARLDPDIPSRWRGHAYLLYEGNRPRIVDDGVLLVGDAAGLAYPASGEGIRPAVESGIMAAETILAAQGRFGRRDLEPYRARIRARFGRGGPVLPIPLPAAVLAGAGRRLMGAGWFARRVVLDRWFLHAGLPALETPRHPRAHRAAAP